MSIDSSSSRPISVTLGVLCSYPDGQCPNIQVKNASGVVIANPTRVNSPTATVGGGETLSASIENEALNTASNWQWSEPQDSPLSVSETIVENYFFSDQSAQKQEMQPFDYSQSSLGPFYWSGMAAGSEDVPVSAEVLRSDEEELSEPSADASISVVAPTLTLAISNAFMRAYTNATAEEQVTHPNDVIYELHLGALTVQNGGMMDDLVSGKLGAYGGNFTMSQLIGDTFAQAPSPPFPTEVIPTKIDACAAFPDIKSALAGGNPRTVASAST